MEHLGKFGLTILYVLLGLAFMGLAFLVISRFSKFSIRKEIEEDQNVAVAVLIGSVLVGIAFIIAAAIHGS